MDIESHVPSEGFERRNSLRDCLGVFEVIAANKPELKVKAVDNITALFEQSRFHEAPKALSHFFEKKEGRTFFAPEEAEVLFVAEKTEEGYLMGVFFAPEGRSKLSSLFPGIGKRGKGINSLRLMDIIVVDGHGAKRLIHPEISKYEAMEKPYFLKKEYVSPYIFLDANTSDEEYSRISSELKRSNPDEDVRPLVSRDDSLQLLKEAIEESGDLTSLSKGIAELALTNPAELREIGKSMLYGMPAFIKKLFGKLFTSGQSIKSQVVLQPA